MILPYRPAPRAAERRQSMLISKCLPHTFVLRCLTAGAEVSLPAVRELAEVQRLGEAYLLAFPAEANREVLADLLSPVLRTGSWEAMVLAILADMQTAAWVRLEDWTLTRTEARVFALAFLASVKSGLIESASSLGS